jgi:tRNA (guanine-N7-)-methyltransferase
VKSAFDVDISKLIAYHDGDRPLDWFQVFQNHNPVEIEIGFGYGEHLIQKALNCRERNFVGIEENWERTFKALKDMTKLAIQHEDPSMFRHVKILKMDALVAFERLIREKSLDNIDCLFPCPWPKKKHIKHRLFDTAFLQLLNNRLKPGTSLKVVTDFAPYRDWIFEQVDGAGFQCQHNVVKASYQTKFEKKWSAQGQTDFFEIQLQKKKHLKVEVKKDCFLKSYRLKEFEVEQA